jgi:hypothetical protein
MIDDMEEKVLDFGGKFGVAELLKRTKAMPPPAEAPTVKPEPEAEPAEETDTGTDGATALEKLTPLPKPGDPYKAHARPEKRAVPTLFVVRADGSVRGFPYSDLYGPDLLPEGDAGKGWSIVLRFARFEQVTLSGRNLDTIHAYLGHHRIAWVRELPKGKLQAERDAAVITGVSIAAIDR